MTVLIKTLTVIAAGTMLATSALAQSAKIEHHIVRIDGTRFHYVTAGTGDPVLLLPGVAPELDRLAEGSAFAGQRRPQRRRTRPSRFR